MAIKRFAILFGLSACLCAAATLDAPRHDSVLDVYAKPGELIDIGAGRHLNLRCKGRGAPTVMLESGATADSMTWSKVQPLVAKLARVCAYDRAGYGYSDGGPLPRNLDASTDDLHALILAAKIATPIILVGHSYGTNIARRYADKHPGELAGIVLLDPPEQDLAEFSAPMAKAGDKIDADFIDFLRMCEKGAQEGKLVPPTLQLKGCLRPPDPQLRVELDAALRANKVRPLFWQSVISYYQSKNAVYNVPVSPGENHGAIPLLILQPDETYADDSPGDIKIFEAARAQTHKLIAATSTRSEIIPVSQSSHEVEQDRPDAVVEAIAKTIKLATAKSVSIKSK